MIFWKEKLLQRVTSELCNGLRVIFCNEQLLQRVTSDFLQRSTSTTSNEQILPLVTSDFTTSNEQRVKSYASLQIYTCRFLKKLFLTIYINVVNTLVPLYQIIFLQIKTISSFVKKHHKQKF